MSNNEKLNSSSHEKLELNNEQVSELQEALRNKNESERKNYDKADNIAKSRHEVEAAFEADGGKRGNKTTQPKQATPSRKIIKKATKDQKKTEYKKTMKEIQKEMTPAERTFSKVIHNPVVEKTSEVAGATVARPAALLAGSLTAFILVSLVYIVAKYFGYPLSGAESIIAFAIGWVLGLLIDWLRVMISGKRDA
jgi:hypothetical protein